MVEAMSKSALSRRSRFGGLWSHRDFRTLWIGQTISLFGSRVTLLALPLTAILALHAGPMQMGVLMAAESAPVLLVGLPAGALVDRLRRRPIMIAADLGRAAILFSLPVAAWLGDLRLAQLYVAGFLAGALTVLFDVAYQSFLPSLLRREQLVEGNARLEVSASVAQIAGPGLGGALVQALTAPVAIAADALSFALSALCLALIRAPEPAPVRGRGLGVRREVVEGVRAVVSDPLLRSLAASSATFNLFDSVLFAVYVLYMTRMLGLAAASVGLVFGLAGIGGVAGALLVAPLTVRVGVGRTVLWGGSLAVAGELLIAAAAGPQVVVVLLLIVAETAVEGGATLYAVTTASVRQATTPQHLQGRVAATMRVAGLGVGPVGAMLGGALGGAIGLRATVVVAGFGTLLALLWIVLSPLRSIIEMPELIPDSPAAP